jgi:hypothetical protein
LNAQWGNDARVTCTLQRDTVGAKNVSLVAANRSTPLLKSEWSNPVLLLLCAPGYFGVLGEMCLPCATALQGAACPGGEAELDLVTSLAGWWRYNVSGSSAACSTRPGRSATCPVLVPCLPAASSLDSGACLGGNLCAPEYTGDRCGTCSAGYYRSSGSCIPCPSSPLALIIAFLLIAVIATGVAYFLNKYNVSLMLITIGYVGNCAALSIHCI